MVRKNPTLAAILNFIIWGVGYIYLGKKLNFAIILVIAEMVFVGSAFIEPWPTLLTVGLLVASIAFAYDAYKEAK